MTPLEVLEAATREQLADRSGNPLSVRLLPPATEEQLDVLQRSAGDQVGPDLLQVLGVASGFTFGPIGTVDLLGRGMLVETFFRSVPILGDDAGNFWILDLEGGPDIPAAVLFWCHDPPVVVLQAPTLAVFFQQIFGLGRPPHEDPLTLVTRTSARRIWSQDPFLVPAADACEVPDEELSRFAHSLPAGYHVADLRHRESGAGFSWGRSGAALRRAGPALIFGVERVGWLTRLFA